MSTPPEVGDGFGWIGSRPTLAPPDQTPALNPPSLDQQGFTERPGSWGGRSPGAGGQGRRGGIVGTILAAGYAVLKWGVVLLKLGAFKGTLITMVISVVVYSVFFGPIFAIGFVLLLLLHEMGHYLMARRLGQSVSAPVFIPLLGALINMRRQPANVQQEATMALCGPVVGTVAAWACVLTAVALRSEFWAALGYLGCLLNLFNLIPASPLDGGRVTAAISRWANLVGLGILGLYAAWSLTSGRAVSPVIVIIVIFAVFGTFSRFRQARRMPQYLAVPARQRWLFLGGYLALVLVAGLGVVRAYSFLHYVHTVHPFGF